ncbi:hypothetical protein [Kineosporia succinea]|uniref:Uncharacterized protein n=1 Tax=Kineosporia succinea TaxID=84632 RepID=A0ABT9P871_9ACTN|nr:hypothetical protein [Kineosporia succinea]MDP9828896.1 hypothetical protein [Kineosporia succinea]
MRLRAFLGIGLIVVLSACGGRGDVQVVEAASASSPGTDCGSFTLAAGERISDRAADCFLGAVTAGDAARLEVTFPTVEGDEIVQTYRHEQAGEVVVTTGRDGEAQQTQSCTDPVRASVSFTFGACRQALS